ncbi:disulfide bond formation protein B [Methylobacterium sp. NEAU 140]|uniref:disulfide bond formation protein B n=1 Tax=Methylobacterium sp. NEAU 140 TaxID=3064945 RepID=UPI002736B337|nr:disulfide bond formation protein B [Methylobacterium sp. NEAU 140]MDP4023893.1 disulfide bond formation protein B [Methylobacterium sp. NEAU 140]
MIRAARTAPGADLARLGDLGLLAMLTGLAAVLTVAMVLQYVDGELPCPLCLLQRVALFGVCFGLIRHFRPDDRGRGVGVALLGALSLLVIAGRQTLLDICPRPGHEYVGDAVLGLHMPVWSVLIALAVIAALAAQVAVVGGTAEGRVPSPRLVRVAGYVGLYVLTLCALNLVSAILQCGLGACHTDGYRMLGSAAAAFARL